LPSETTLSQNHHQIIRISSKTFIGLSIDLLSGDSIGRTANAIYSDAQGVQLSTFWAERTGSRGSH